MKIIIGYFKDFHRQYFQWKMYLCLLIFITSLIFINYTYDFEDGYIDSFYGTLWRLPLFFGMHGLPYFGALIIIISFRKQWPDKKFWIKSSLGILILATDRTVYPFIAEPILSKVPPETYLFVRKIINNLYVWITIALPLVFLKIWLDRNTKEGLYGLRFSNVHIGVYWIMLLIMIPIIYAGSHIPEFIDYYPQYKRAGGAGFATFYHLPEFASKLLYEISYLLRFFNVELFFRGFLIIGLSQLAGKDVVIPMAATYAALHFGKPITETISSVFGGYILGILALYSRNIWGGIFIHAGVAFLMEIFAFLQQ